MISWVLLLKTRLEYVFNFSKIHLRDTTFLKKIHLCMILLNRDLAPPPGTESTADTLILKQKIGKSDDSDCRGDAGMARPQHGGPALLKWLTVSPPAMLLLLTV